MRRGARRIGGTQNVKVTNLLIVAETDKAYGVVQFSHITSQVDPRMVVTYNEARRATDIALMWLPKKVLSNVKVEEYIMFPMLRQSVENPSTRYRSKLTADIPLYLAIAKRLVDPPESPEDLEDIIHNVSTAQSGW